ncbi:MAG: hypothetical protein IKI04_03370, partial [Bacilli bacterium]|nr:hypothetical protein [Bacilli bacterium]
NAVIDNISSTYVTNANGVQFNAISSDTNGKGVYIRSGTENMDYPIYYYRGAVDNNNLLFGGFCWKIVRTTDTGGIKLIYNGLPSGTNSDQCTNTTGTSTQLATTSRFNYLASSVTDVGYMYGTRYDPDSKSSSKLATPYLYGNGFTYGNGTYTLTNTITSTGNWATDYNTLNNNHYTCFNTTGTCTSIYYVFNTDPSYVYYIALTNGKSVTDALTEMFSNITDSMIKTAIDNWYSTNMTSYTPLLEDAIYCNDRSIYRLNGWDPNGGDVTNYLYFSPYNRVYTTHTPSLTCSKNDSFTVTESATGNGKLTYPVGLLTSDEIMLAGGKEFTQNSTYYLYTNQSYWSGSPNYYGSVGSVRYVSSVGNISYDGMNNIFGVRPVVSLKSGTQVSGGNGTVSDPYVVE